MQPAQQIIDDKKLICEDEFFLWSSPDLSIDGVIVNNIGQDIIHGDGEWDPPDGWKPFKVQITSGELVES